VEEIPAILKLWNELEGESSAILATVVRVRGSAYRRPGARLLFTTDGRRAGSISGGCLEGDLIRKSWWWTEEGSRIVTYGTGPGDDGTFEFGLGCNGIIDILVERAGSAAGRGLRRFIGDCRTRRQAGLIATVVEASGEMSRYLTSRVLLFPDGACETEIDCPELLLRIRDDAKSVLRHKQSTCIRYTGINDSALAFMEVVAAPVRLVIFGAGFDAVPLAAFASGLGWEVVVVDHRSAQATFTRFRDSGAAVVHSIDEDLQDVPLDPDSIVVVMTHSYERDRTLLRHLLPKQLRYLGLLGPRERTRRLLAEMPDDANRRGSLHFPAGLDIGSDSPASVALAIVAEIQAVIAGRGGGMLRDRPGAIHDDGQQVYRLQTAGA
jgi:xanthine/CO dehydrogenase XdhC/CoxF family maturation factor